MNQQDIKSPHQFLFSVVTAAYNAEPWIDLMLSSLVQQSLDFEKHIQVIVIDDGSSDETAAVVRRRAEEYPRNITLLHQENGGPASARNRGLESVLGAWVTFIDADDFVSPSYFETVHSFLESAGFEGPIVACNTLPFYDGRNRATNDHPLAYKFRTTRIVDLLQEPDHIQLFANCCFFRREVLGRTGLRFDERVRPTFEDAHFLNLLLLRAGDFRLAFIKDAHYYYRRRGEGTGLVEGGWANPAKYHDQILFGYLHLVQQYQRSRDCIPKFIQNLVIYEAHWYMVRLMEGLPDCPLSSAQRESFFELMRLVFRHIDMRQILLSQLPVLELRTRIAMLKAFKGCRFTSFPPIVTEISPCQSQAQLTHWSTDEASCHLYEDTQERPLSWQKNIVHKYDETTLCHEYRYWIPLRNKSNSRIEIDGEPVGIFCRDSVLDTFCGDLLRKTFYLPDSSLTAQQKILLSSGVRQEEIVYKGCWLFMDRVHKADDNAEHFFRWLQKHHPEKPIYFVLDRKSKDWLRLKKNGFSLLAYRSKKHFAALMNAEWLISSHVDLPVTDPIGTRTRFGTPSYKVAFLQHGIIKEDLSGWLNEFSLDCMVTSTHQEYESILHGRYKLTKRELVLTGLPRHDQLLRNSQTRKASRNILLCPTWREHLRQTQAHIPGLQSKEAQAFQQSDYFRRWNEVTGSRNLNNLAREYGYKILFLPHPEIVRFLPLFQTSESVVLIDWTKLKSVQDIMLNSAMAVTDYSSFVFDMAYIGRPVGYYQFPEQPEMFSNRRSQGYFRYDAHGLGPVLHTQDALEDWINETLRQGCIRQEPYSSRADAFFTLRDGKNCSRVYNAIIARS